MNEIREIVTKAVASKGRKIIRLTDVVTPNRDPFSILGCWVINHEFEACLADDRVEVIGSFEINIWYAYDNNTATDIAKKVVGYTEVVKTRQLVKDLCSNTRDVIVRVLQQPTCTNARIVDQNIEVDIIFEVIAEIIGETKMVVTVLTPNETCEALDDDFENEINENFINGQ